MNETILGKITRVHFGVSEGRFGLILTLAGSWGVVVTEQCWDPTITPPSEHARWNLQDQNNELAKICRKVSQLLADAKVDDVSKLQNKPVEFTSEGGIIKSWRILTEVL